MKYWAIFILFLFVQLVISCTGSTYVSEVLTRAEVLMADHPDSAQQVLNLLDRESIKGEKELADYAFLMTKALYKNYADAKDDKLIMVAVNYYEKKGFYSKLAEALMLQGSILMANKLYSDAMLCFQHSADLGETVGDNYLLGHIYSNMYDLCRFAYNADQIDFAERALEYYRKTGNESYIIDAKANLGIANYRIKNFEKSEALLDSVYSVALETADTFSIVKSVPFLAVLKAQKKEYEVSDSLFSLLKNKYNYKLQARDIWVLSESKLSNGEKAAAIELMDYASRMKMSSSTRMVFCSLAGSFYSQIGDYKSAWNYLNEYVHQKDSIGNVRYQETVMSSQRDYVTQKLEIQQIRESRNLIIILLIFVTVVSLFLFIIYYIRRRLQIQTLEMENMILQISDLNQAVTGKNITIDGLNQKIQQTTDETKSMKVKISDLYEQKYQQINNLCISYFNGQNTLHTKNAIYKEVHSIIEGFGKDEKSFLELENIVNVSRNGILDNLKNDIPNLRIEEYKFFCYVFAGFSSRSISLLLNENVDTVYQHRSRWKKRIEAMDITTKALYLDLL